MIKTRLEGVKGIWPDELPGVLWAYWTTACIATGKTHFRLTFGNEAVIPTEVGLTSDQISHHNEKRNEEEICLELDLLDKVRATTEHQIARYQDLMAKHYNIKVRPFHFSGQGFGAEESNDSY